MSALQEFLKYLQEDARARNSLEAYRYWHAGQELIKKFTEVYTELFIKFREQEGLAAAASIQLFFLMPYAKQVTE